ncbi:MAG: hypothetical protein H6587_07690 [Flavobacteriales bacterium]|nr:hypothetical protein [Flavobacteriales bacterium]MCB9364434.1 hypothetical protein [Flavobacteriales bacterium]
MKNKLTLFKKNIKNNDMKNKLTLLATFLLLSWGVFAQNVPEKINYQAVARNLAGIPLVSTPIIVVFDIIQGSQTGPSVYSETHVDTTNQFGLFNLEIGGGTTSGNFSTINWSSGSYYLRVTVNGDVMPATQLLSVPYALHAKTATSGVPGADGYNSLLDTLSAGAVCPNGGYQVLMGLDTDASGILDAGEVTKTFIVCNGADGATGPAGANGTTYFAGNGISLSNDTITNLGDADNDSSNELITLTNLNGNIIEITESGTLHSIDLTSVLGASYTQGAGISIVGNTISASDTSITNELQTLSLNIAQDSIFISSGNGIQLPNTTGADDWGNDTVNVAGGNIMGSGTVSNPLMVIDNDTSATNEFQDLSVNATNGNEINISNGTGFFLSQVPPSATNQVLTWNGSNWVAQNPGSGADNWGTQYVIADGTTITGTGIAGDTLRGFDGDYNSLSNQPTIPTNTSDLTNDSGFITNPDDADFDPNNEIQNLTISGNYIGVSGGLGDSISAVQPAIGDYLYWNGVNWIGQSIAGNTDNQNLGNGGKSGNDQTLVIQNGTGVTFSVADGDSVATNELQTISASGGTSPQIDLSIGGGNVKILGTGGTTVNQAGNAITINSTTGTTYTAGTGIDITTGTISNTSLNTDDQQLTYNAGTQTLQLTTTTTPSTVTLDVNDADASTTNELITSFGVNGANLEIIEAGTTRTVPLSSLSTPDNDWTIVGSTIYRSIGNVGVGQNIAGSNIKFRVLADDSVGVSVENNSASYAAIDARNMGGGLAGKFRDGNVHIQNNLGIGNTAATPTYNLQVDGTTWSKGMRLGITGSEYDMPNTNGFLGQVLTTNASGNAEWQTPATTATYWDGSAGAIYPTTLTDNVGIGTSTPALGRKLEVINNDVVANNMAIHGQSSGANASNIGVQGYALNSTSQNVGVSGIGQGNTGTNYGVSGSATGAATTNMGVYGNASGGTNNYAGYFSGGNVYVSNNLGVGISSPTHKLDVQSNSFELLKLTTTGANSNVNVDINTTGSGAAQFTVTGGTGGFSFVTDGTWPTSAMNIIDNGNVGIGTTNPSLFKLHVESSTNRRSGYFFNNLSAANIVNNEIMGIYGGAMGTGASDKIGGFFETSGGSGINYGVYGQAMGGATNWAGYFAGGNVYIQNNLGVGVTSPSSKLDVNGTINISNNAGEINNSVKTGAANLLPIAYGNIAQDANINASTGNFSVIWNATNLWYEITIIGEAFNFSNYIVNVTRISGISGVTEATSSLGGKLIVVFNDQGGTKVQNAFQFVVYKP